MSARKLQSLVVYWCAAVICCLGYSSVSAQSELALGKESAAVLTSDSRVIRSLPLRQGQVANLSVKHRATTVYLKVVSPSGRKVITKVAPTLWYGETEVFFKSSESGRHQVIAATERPGKTSGTVTIVLTELRPALPSDEPRLTAHKEMSEADDLRTSLYDVDSVRSRRDDARKKYETAIRLFQEISDRRSVAGAQLRLGDFLYEEFDDFPASESSLDKAISSFDEMGDPTGSALSRILKIFPIFFSRGRVAEVDRLVDEAKLLTGSLGDIGLEGRLNIVQARISLNTGSGPRAIELVNTHGATVGDLDLEGRFWGEHVLLSASAAMGDQRLKLIALNSLFKSYEVIKGRVHPRYIVNPLFTTALNFHENKQSSKGEALFRQVLSICEKTGRQRSLAFYLREFGEFYMYRREFSRARPYLLRSLNLYEKVSPFEAQGIYNALGVLYLETSEPLKAKELFEKAAARNRENGDRYAEGNSIANLARAEMDLGRLEDALAAIDSAFVLGLAHLDQLYTRSSRTGFNTWILRTYSEIKISILYRLYEKTRDIAHLESAFETQERTHARTLLEVVYSSGYDATATTDPELLKTKNEVLSRISQLENQSRRSPQNRSDVEVELTRLILEYEGIEDQIRNLNPRSEALNNPKAVRLADVRQIIDPETAVIEYSLGEKESFVWVITEDTLNMFRLPPKREINDLAKRFRGASSSREAASAKELVRVGRLLSTAVLKPFYSGVKDFKRLLIVPDDGLTSISFSGLPAGAETGQVSLIENHELVSLPSVSTLLALRKAKRQAPGVDWNRLVAVVADPVFESTDERLPRSLPRQTRTERRDDLIRALPDFSLENLVRLPFTNVEARRISSIAEGRSTVLSGTEASREKLMNGELSDYRVLHFATHGFLNNLHPELSGIVLSLYDRERRPTDGFLRAIDLYSLKLNADLVVLSGCKTAAGETMRSEGIIGVTRGFMYAGVPTVIASLWDVDDSATSHFMEKFYDSLINKQMTPSGALRDAKLQFIKNPRFSSPKYWAAFVVQGEYDVYFK